MSLRELKSLTSEGTAPEATLSILQSGKRMDTPTVSDLNTHEDSEERAEVLELHQKLTMATEQLETVRAELTMQRHQTRQVAEATKEESEGKENWVLPNLTKEKVQKHLASLKKVTLMW